MLSRNWKLPTNLPICFYADSFHRTAQDTLFSQLSDLTLPEQFEQAQSNLLQLKQDIEKDMPPIHYAAQFGSHICTEDIFKQASNRLKFLALMQPAPLEPAQPPATKQPPLSSQDITTILGKIIEMSDPETFLGEQRKTTE
jgi:hypothetical protein